VRALVTGSAGFLGRHFVAALRSRQYNVTEVDVHGLFRAESVFSGGYAAGNAFDLVVHCAAVEPHRSAIDGQPMHLAQNLMLDAGMFDWAVRTGQKRVLYISSSAAYPVDMQRGHYGALREKDIAIPRSVPGQSWENVGLPDAGYGWLKLTGERLAADAARAGLPVHIVRPFSGYGENQGENWPFGAFAARARRRDDPFTIWGDGTQVRDWIHVTDLVAGALAVVDQDVREPVNLCTGVGTSMADLVQLFCKTAGYSPDIELRADQPAGVAYRVGDPARFRGIYLPKVDIGEGVARALR
jgi:nucleoside-diphosphate-sugar epimerase